MAWRVVAQVSAFLLLCYQGVFSQNDGCAEVWETYTKAALYGSQEDFSAHVGQIADIVTITYTGEYNASIDGWTLISRNDPDVGMHAVVYQDDSAPNRVVIAFRGTSLEGREGECDMCAGQKIDGSILEPYCQQFTEEEIDYFSQAKNFTLQVLSSFPNSCLLFSGHSLGATLGELMSNHYSGDITAMVFSTSGTMEAGPRLGAGTDFDGIINTYAQYDPVIYLDDPSLVVGTKCEFKEDLTKNCEDCYSSENPSYDLTNLTDICGQCFVDTHYYSHILYLVHDSGTRPVCYQLDGDDWLPVSDVSTNCRPATILYWVIAAYVMNVFIGAATFQ